MAEDTEQPSTLELAAELTIAWLSNPNTGASADDVPAFLHKVHTALNEMASPQAVAEQPPGQQYPPAVGVRKSLASKDHIISLIDGKPYKTLRRHLSGHGLTPDDYRQRYGLKPDYPMVSESYSQVRRDMARKIGLGRKPGAKVTAPARSAAVVKSAEAAAPPAKGEVKPAKAAKDPVGSVKAEKKSAAVAEKSVTDAVTPANAARKPRAPKVPSA